MGKERIRKRMLEEVFQTLNYVYFLGDPKFLVELLCDQKFSMDSFVYFFPLNPFDKKIKRTKMGFTTKLKSRIKSHMNNYKNMYGEELNSCMILRPTRNAKLLESFLVDFFAYLEEESRAHDDSIPLFEKSKEILHVSLLEIVALFSESNHGHFKKIIYWIYSSQINKINKEIMNWEKPQRNLTIENWIESNDLIVPSLSSFKDGEDIAGSQVDAQKYFKKYKLK